MWLQFLFLTTSLADVNQVNQCTYKQNTEARSCKHCCIDKAISITYFQCVSVALVSQQAMRMRHIVACGLSGSIVFIHIIW